MTNRDLAVKAGINLLQFTAISQQTDWKGVDLPTMQRFLMACGLDFENPVAVKRARTYLRGKRKNGLSVPPRFTRFQNSPIWVSELEPLAKIFLSHVNQ